MASKNHIGNCTYQEPLSTNHSNSNGFAHTNHDANGGHAAQNGHSHAATNGHSNGFHHFSDEECSVATPEMCSYCFDVLESELNNYGSPAKPNFTNDA